MVRAIQTVFEQFNIEINLSRNICLFDSLNPLIAGKQSGHLIIDGYYHQDSNEARLFYETVIQHVNPEYRTYVDPKVYSDIQQFRLLGSQKPGSHRFKKFLDSWSYNHEIIKYEYIEEPESPDHRFLLQFAASAISFIAESKPLFCLDSTVSNRTFISPLSDLSPSLISSAIQLLAKHGKMSTDDPRFPFQYSHVDGPFIILKRLRSSYCSSCKRPHENENPFLFITQYHEVCYSCRRSSHKIHLGQIYSSSLSPVLIQVSQPIIQSILPRLDYINDLRMEKYLNNFPYTPSLQSQKFSHKFIKAILKYPAQYPLRSQPHHPHQPQFSIIPPRILIQQKQSLKLISKFRNKITSLLS